MFRTSTILSTLLLAMAGYAIDLSGQSVNSNAGIPELPVVLSWDDDGIRIRTKNPDQVSNKFLNMKPSQYLEKIGNDFIRVNMGAGNTPVIIDLSNYFNQLSSTAQASTYNLIESAEPFVDIEMPKLSLSNYQEPNSFVVTLQNFSGKRRYSQQKIVFKGIDVFYIGADNCAELSAERNSITIDVDRCKVNYLLLKGGLLNVGNVDEKIPALCRKYNSRYYGQVDAFVCLEDCRGKDPDSEANLKHTRKLITKYNITDFEDEPISFLDDMILTKKGVGLNLKVQQVEGLKGKKRSKSVSYSAYDSYQFFPWFEFINLSFEKYAGDKQLMIRDPYNNSFIYNSKIHFSNVELIQFFNELKSVITAEVN